MARERPVQFFTPEYLEQVRDATPEQVLEFLEDFRLMQAAHQPSRLISLKVPQALLDAFRARCELQGVRYQTQIKTLMRDWLKGGD